MKIEQVFTESDLLELKQVLAKSMEPTNSVIRLLMKWLRFWQKHQRAIKFTFLIGVILLCVLCTFCIVEREKLWLYKVMALISAAFVVLYIHQFFTWDKLIERVDNFLTLKKLYKNTVSLLWSRWKKILYISENWISPFPV